MDENIFALRLKELLQEKDMRQNALAKKLYREPLTVYRWVHGKQTPDDAIIDQISTILGVRFEYLKGIDNYKTEEDITIAHQNLSKEEINDIINDSQNILFTFRLTMQYGSIIKLLESPPFSQYNISEIKNKSHFYNYLETEITRSIESYMKYFNDNNN